MNALSDYACVAAGMAWLNEHLPLLDGLDITTVAVTVHDVQIQLGTHDEVTALVADLTEKAGLDFAVRRTSGAHMTFKAMYALDVVPGERLVDRLTVTVSSYQPATRKAVSA